MAKWSSRFCSGNLLLVLVLLAGARGQEKNGEFKHELPDGVELVDPKSLGLTDADLSKFLGNVKVLGGGQVGDTKTQILTVGFEGDENINFNDFTIPGLTDGNNTALPQKDKEIADMAFQKFKEFFQDPNKAKEFEEGKHNINLAFKPQKNNDAPKHRPQPQQNNIHNNNIRHHPPQLRIPMIQKPYTTPRTPHHPPQQHQHPHPHPRLQPPPPPHPPPPVRQFNNPAAAQTQNHQQQQHIFNSQIKSQPPLEFGARIPLPPIAQARPPPPPQQQQYQHHHQSQGQFHHHRQHEQQQQHRLTIQHQQQGQNFQRPPPPPHQQHNNQPPPQHFQQQRGPPPQVQHHAPQTPRIRFPQDVQPPHQQNQPNFPPGSHAPPVPHHQIPQRGHGPQQPSPNPPPPPSQVAHQPRPPLVQNFVIHPRPPQQQQQSQHQIQHQPPPAPETREQGRIVRNQLLQLESNNQESVYDGPSKGLRPPPPPQSYESSSNQVPVHSPSPAHFHNQQPPTASATATSSVYIHRGPKNANIQQTSFHPQFQPPTRFAKDFTPMPIQTTTGKPDSFEVTPSMKLIPLSTNENAITDPTRMLQLRLYQQQKAQALAQASNTHQIQAELPRTTVPTPPTTTPISITTSYPETNDPSQEFSSPAQYEFPGSQQAQQLSASFDHNNNIANQISDNALTIQYNNAPFSVQTQQQQHQLHFVQDKPSLQPPQQQFHQQVQSNQPTPTVYYTQDHRRPPRQGPPPHPPRFQFHVAHDLGQGPRFQMHPDPKNLLNTIRRKRGYRRLSNLFNRMFRWDRN